MSFSRIALAALALALPAPASAAITVSDGSDPAPYVALLSQSYMPLPAMFAVVPSPGGCPGQVPPGYTRPAACADSTMRLYVDPARVLDPSSNGQMVMTHETGHIVDFTIRARDNGATDAAFDAIMTQAGVTGSRLEQFADTWAECAMYGPTGDTEVITPSYSFHVPADAYAQACDLFRQASADFTAAPATYQGAPWRRQAQPGDCMENGYVVACPQPVAHRAVHHRSRPCWRRAYRRHHRVACRPWQRRHHH